MPQPNKTVQEKNNNAVARITNLEKEAKESRSKLLQSIEMNENNEVIIAVLQ